MTAAPLHNPTPLMHSTPLSRKTQTNVWLKLENLQPSGSFKMRGLGHMCQKAVQEHGKATHLVCSSGGNAGLAVAYAGRQLDVRVTIVVPLSCSQFMKQKIESEGATVEMEGEAWDEADLRARTIVANDPHGVYVPPFDHPDIWAGNSTMVDELKTQMGGIVPDAIVCSVGGGGMLNGVILGCERAGWDRVPIIAIETHGANSFQQAVVAGKLVTLPKITSVATTLGAKRVSAKSLELSFVHPVIPFAVSDSMACRACWQFLDDHRILVEPSCGASLSVAYTPSLLSNVLPHLNHQSNVVMIVCGGSNINFEQLTDFKTKFASQGQQPAIAVRNGDQIMLKMTHSLQEKESTPAQRFIISTLYRSPVSESDEAATNGVSATNGSSALDAKSLSAPATNHDDHVAVKTEETNE
ncbi:L-serine/L-threonine ammonia-lyase [Entomortierella parvispora]|uniref:L-serine ammonia-lyase n=1 Tax=Entomortierella parvispora TaxID=205924 RepID=A0A9P3H2U9_9FUNG|nr:L-serine/L-threonine ammonia-lyase [Entomortierella parvispora]